MINYILIAAIAWITFGVVNLIEKFILIKPLRNPIGLAFYTGIFAIFPVIIFLPLARFSSWPHIIFDIFCGVIFFIGQLLLYQALFSGDAGEVIPVTGSLVPVFTLIISLFALHLNFTFKEVSAIALFVCGTFLLSEPKHFMNKRIMGDAIAASLFFALYYSLIKIAYTPFEANFAFVRMGSFAAALPILAVGSLRRQIFVKQPDRGRKLSGLIVTKEILAGLAFIALNYAISIGNPAVANAMQGVEYAFVFLAALFLTEHGPKILKESINHETSERRFLAIILIFIGLIILQI
ncbi:DMT family transporter [Patescibacteria group bacterium]|nr:DMT family transporter [Patescibacteria group bacterium]